MLDRRRTTRAARRHPTGSFDPVAVPEIGGLVGDKYRVVELVGEGAMGMVLHGRDERLERDVAIKLIRPELAANPGFQEHFLAEARTMAKINHPNVVGVFDFGWDGRTPFFVMEFIEGWNLESELERARMPLGDAIDILDQVCRGVEAIHEAGAVHRDLKPGNVMVDRGSRVVVGDFGLACSVTMVDSAASPGGTPGFIAPELATLNLMGEQMDSGPLVQRSDVYALGSLAYEMLTGEPAFAGTTVNEILSAQFTGTVTRPSLMCPTLSPAFDGPILAALCHVPENRTPSAAEFRAALMQARKDAEDPSFGRRVIIAEPDPACRERMAAALRDALPMISLALVENGAGVLREVSAQPTALLILEPALPDLRGQDLVARLRSDDRLESLAIAIVSDQIDPSQWHALRDAGADGFLIKPEDPVMLTALARSLLADPLRRRVGR
ncbi:serine/threonine-protein kinase [Paraliomyxa miuraensis]|uniref:serine/threonine-protein kinase n=1 Tax=Paraliomyxa miuraensis TaxID=376150 RepID=UPI00224CD850|nr:serine/threonine-protein kinase [Paraliomyxa miuraensis]MCX4240887.1 protein kinase [Paraliomyxa miuraensis]